MMMSGRCAPHFLFETSKRKCAAPGGKENMFGGSVCAGADLLPPAGGWLTVLCGSQGRKRATLGETTSPGKSGIHPAPLFAAALLAVRESPELFTVGAVINRPPHRGPDGHRRADRGGSSVIKNNLPALGAAGGWDIRWCNERGVLPAQMLCILRQVRWSGFPRLWQPIDSIVALQSATPHFRAAKRTIQTNLLLFRYPQERDLGKPSVFPVLSPAAKEDLSIIFGRTCACRKFPAPGAWGAVHQ